MPRVVGITFRRVGKVYYFDPGDLELREGDFVIAETARGVEFGEVVLEPRTVPDEDLVAPLKNIVRVASGDDLGREADNREREKHAFEVCERKIAAHGLPMKLLETECAFDGSMITFSFSADGRVDFRELVKDLAGALRTKVQLHQIGVRDEAKLVGGYGTCGRPLCCATFLSSFEPISMKMAKDQSLFLNPAKFSGCCGKLMCCLRYEHEFYREAQQRLPAVGAIIPFRESRAKVIDVNVISDEITLQTEEDVQVHVSAHDLDLAGLCRRHGIGCTMRENGCRPLSPTSDLNEPAREREEAEEDDEDDDVSDNEVEVLSEPGSIATPDSNPPQSAEASPRAPRPGRKGGKNSANKRRSRPGRRPRPEPGREPTTEA